MLVSVRLYSRGFLISIGLLWLSGCASGPGGPPSSRPQALSSNVVSHPVSSSASQQGAGPVASQSSGTPGGAQVSGPPDTPSERPLTARPGKPRYTLTGTLSTEYLYDYLLSPSPSQTSQNRLGQYLNFRLRNLQGPDLRLYFSGSYAHDFLNQGNDQYQIYKLFAEWNNLGSVLTLRVGRQPTSGNTLFSRFDGATVSYRPVPQFSLSLGGGYPVNTSYRADRAGMQTDLRFYEVYAMVYDWYHLTGRLYFTQETYQSFQTRNAAGLNGFWTRGNVNLTTMVDYDFDFARLNNATATADYTWGIAHYSLGADYRRTPYLDYENALQDPNYCGATPPINSFADLVRQLPRSVIESCAMKITSHLSELRGGVSVDFSKVWRGELQFVYGTGKAVEFITTGGVITATLANRLSNRVSLFVSERNGLHVGELWTLLLVYQPASDMQELSLFSTLSKYWGNALQAALRIRVDQLSVDLSGITTTSLVPGLILSYTLPSGLSASLEGDYDVIMNSNAPTTNNIQTRTTITIPF
jgi:hypothetical protein